MHEDDAPTLANSHEAAPDVAFGDDGSPESRYARTGRLGVGAMGEVHLCEDLRIGRSVALKVALAGGAEAAAAHARFIHEARVQAQLEHPSIVPVYDVGRDASGAPYFTMKRIRGVTLKRVLQSGEYSRRRLLDAFARVCMTVQYAHSRGVLHRDLKPANVMLGDYGELYVLDWGVARVVHAGDGSEEALEASPDLTQKGDLIGTPGYIAPEQVRGEPHDERSDVYALGAILFEILAGEPLHRAATTATLLVQMMKPVDARPSARARAANVPPELDAICAKAAAFDPRERFQSARELHDALDRYLEGDRDLERRRIASAEHARAAQEIASSPLATTDAESTARVRAMSEVSRALALDPENRDARSVLLRLLVEPPRRMPPEVRDELDRHHHALNQRAARGGTLFYGSACLLLPLLMVLFGSHAPAIVLGCTLAFGVAAASLVRVALMPYRGPRTNYSSIVLTMLALSSLAAFNGPLIYVPMFVTANAAALLLQANRKRRPVILGAAVGAILLPLVLEWVGLVPPSYRMVGGRLVVMSRLIDYTPAAHAIHITITVVFAFAIGLYFMRFRDTLTDAEERLSLHAWQLRQLVPDASDSATRMRL